MSISSVSFITSSFKLHLKLELHEELLNNKTINPVIMSRS